MFRSKTSAVGHSSILALTLLIAVGTVPIVYATEDSAGHISPAAISPEILQRYVGSYQLEDLSLVAISRQDLQLFAQVTGQPKFEVIPTDSIHFTYKNLPAQITFTVGDSAATGLVIHQHGNDVSGNRISDARASEIATATAAKIATQAPTPGSDAALKRYLMGVESGSPQYTEMSEKLAISTRQKEVLLQSTVSQWGPVVSTNFVAVGSRGWDVYHVVFEHGESTWSILLGANGAIENVTKLPN